MEAIALGALTSSLVAALVLALKWFMKHTDNHETHTMQVMEELTKAVIQLTFQSQGEQHALEVLSETVKTVCGEQTSSQ